MALVRVAAPPRLSAGVNTADWTRLGAEVALLAGSDCWAHVDVMDGWFCPALTAGAPLVKAAASAGVPVDAHLMVEEPRRFLAEIVAAGAGVVTVHVEATRHLHRTLVELTALAGAHPGLLRGVALNPGTPVTAVEPVLDLVDLVLVLAVSPGWAGQRPAAGTAGRIAEVRDLVAATRRDVLVEVDGGVTLANASEVASWGADVVVSGSAIYDGGDAPANLVRVREALAAGCRTVPPHRSGQETT